MSNSTCPICGHYTEDLKTHKKFAHDIVEGKVNEGTKHDEGKPPLDLLDKLALEEAAKVMAHGENKYGAFNWRKGLSQRRTLGAALRHIYQHLDGEDIDSESGRLHLGHALCEISFAIRMLRDRPDLDDRYKEPKKVAGFVKEG